MAPLPTPRLLPLGDSAWTLEWGTDIDRETHARVMGLHALVGRLRTSDPLLMHVSDLVPGFRSLTVHYDPWHTDARALGQQLLALAQQDPRGTVQGRRWILPVCFDEDFAPDLPQLCSRKGLSRDAVLQSLLSARFRVYLIGFQPGFPYMGGLPSELATPRLAVPRQRVPARSVAIAGTLCGVYPWESPGGWNLLGRTPVVLFDPSRAEQPAMLAAGDEVQWRAVDRTTHDRLAADIAGGLPRETFLMG